MSDTPTATSVAAPQDKSELIESIYRIALEPQTYDSFMGHWDDFIVGQVSKLNTLQADAATLDETIDETEIRNHFAIAMQLLEQAGRPEPQTKADTPRSRVPQLVFGSTGTLVWHNNAAREVFGIRHGVTLDGFTLSDAHRAKVDDLIGGRTPARVVMTRITPTDGSKPIPMAFQLSSASANERLFMATQVRQAWPENTGALLASGFGLSQSEIDICALLVERQGAADIADSRQSALGTVRTQIKKILQKTDSSGQVELVSLLHATMRLAEEDPLDVIPAAKVPDSVLNIQLKERLMPVETFGDPKGTPVIFFHGMLDGNSMTNGLRRLLHEKGFHLICPVRPSFGAAPPDESDGIASAPTRLARDMEALLEHTGAKRPILLGHMAGAVYAYAAAAHLGKRARGILAVAGAVPITTAAQFASMSVRQRIVALTARYTPRVLPFVVRAGINQLDNAGERQFLHSLYQNSPFDLLAASDLETRDIIIAGYHFTIAQGHRAFEIDSYHVVRDWSANAVDIPHPVELLHGIHDPVVSIASVEGFHKRLGARSTLTALEDTGQLVFYQEPDKVVAALERLRAH